MAAASTSRAPSRVADSAIEARRAEAIGGKVELVAGPDGTVFTLLLPIGAAGSGDARIPA